MGEYNKVPPQEHEMKSYPTPVGDDPVVSMKPPKVCHTGTPGGGLGAKPPFRRSSSLNSQTLRRYKITFFSIVNVTNVITSPQPHLPTSNLASTHPSPLNEFTDTTLLNFKEKLTHLLPSKGEPLLDESEINLVSKNI